MQPLTLTVPAMPAIVVEVLPLTTLLHLLHSLIILSVKIAIKMGHMAQQ